MSDRTKPESQVGEETVAGLSPALVRRIGGGLLLALMGVGALWVVQVLSDPHTLPLRVVRIEGESRHLNRVKLERAVADVTRGGFFNTDVDKVRQAAERLPWVDRASVRRIWPDTLILGVRERVALGRWGERDLVSMEGEVFRPDPLSVPPGLPGLSGPPGSAGELADAFREMQSRLDPLQLQIERLSMNARGAWSMQLANGIQLYLGNTDRSGRLGRFIRIYADLAARDRGPLRVVDLRYANGVAVRRDEEPEPSPKPGFS